MLFPRRPYGRRTTKSRGDANERSEGDATLSRKVSLATDSAEMPLSDYGFEVCSASTRKRRREPPTTGVPGSKLSQYFRQPADAADLALGLGLPETLGDRVCCFSSSQLRRVGS
jgi:hypothetical protein